MMVKRQAQNAVRLGSFPLDTCLQNSCKASSGRQAQFSTAVPLQYTIFLHFVPSVRISSIA